MNDCKIIAHSDFKMVLSFAIIDSNAATALYKQSQNVRKQEFYLWMQKIDQLSLSLEYNWKIALGEFIFHYTIGSSANLKRKFTKYGSTIIKYFLGTVLTKIFGVNTLSKKFFIQLSTKSTKSRG